MRAPSIRLRLTRAALFAVIVGALVGALAAAIAVRRQVHDLMQSSLEETAQVLSVLAEEEHELFEHAGGRALPAPPHEEQLRWQVRARDGRLLARSHQEGSTWSAPLAQGHAEIPGFAVYTERGKRFWVQVAQPLTERNEAQRKAALATALVVLACGAAAALWVALQLRRELRPVAQLARDVEAMQPGVLAVSPPRSPRRELEPVYAALEGLQQRLAEKLAAEQAFSEHAAHSLRTPLAGLTAQLEVAAAQSTPDLQRRLALALDAARRLNGVVAALLAMGRATRSTMTRFAPAALASVLTGRQVEIDTRALAGAPELRGDVDLLSAALANLVDNAVRHGAQAVRVAASRAGPVQTLEVSDDGPGVTADRLALLRATLADGKGAELGLGLALAAAVARGHGGELTIESPPPGQPHGFVARLTWPATA